MLNTKKSTKTQIAHVYIIEEFFLCLVFFIKKNKLFLLVTTLCK